MGGGVTDDSCRACSAHAVAASGQSLGTATGVAVFGTRVSSAQSAAPALGSKAVGDAGPPPPLHAAPMDAQSAKTAAKWATFTDSAYAELKERTLELSPLLDPMQCSFCGTVQR